ncbi:hypothetical protein F2Q68_00044590 [Brassica cretica]|uniref:Uncharacterized protein n=1 Tax=Brassica cretica TaxID=69181 RepID=A0A8S9LPL8_BRACR|nr:hypothetical protein F2Q68_00044590 [Brassica cretica]
MQLRKALAETSPFSLCFGSHSTLTLIQCAPICFGTLIRVRRYRRTLIRFRLRSSSFPPDQLQPQGVPDPRRAQLHPTSRIARNPTGTAPVRIRAARDPIEAARVPASSRPDRV